MSNHMERDNMLTWLKAQNEKKIILRLAGCDKWDTTVINAWAPAYQNLYQQFNKETKHHISNLFDNTTAGGDCKYKGVKKVQGV